MGFRVWGLGFGVWGDEGEKEKTNDALMHTK